MSSLSEDLPASKMRHRYTRDSVKVKLQGVSVGGLLVIQPLPAPERDFFLLLDEKVVG